ncbi:protein FRA10AC1 homolog [Oppia nitens]|uniref:protein FRA10AC1 homolog n=1 Tax=Oppia nitens TaxID=1686743 RepID=UPI0023DADDEE|nr:protein FRA10AC1 homolog [Oppia nitens]
MSADYESNFETESESEDKRQSKRKSLCGKDLSSSSKKQKASKNEFVEETDKYERQIRNRLYSLNAYQRHVLLVNEYILNHPGSTSKFQRDTSRDVTEYEVLKNNHRFIWDETNEDELSWGQRLAKKYYNLLFKEYCISDLSRYKENKFGMRWRTEKEVIEGKGQFICGAKGCDTREELKSWEVLFTYQELGEKKSALVKLRLCEECSNKLNYRQKRKEAKKNKKKHKKDSKDRTDSVISEQERHNQQSEATTSQELQTDTLIDTNKGNDNNVNDIWTKPQPIGNSEPSIDEEFDNYLEDLLI